MKLIYNIKKYINNNFVLINILDVFKSHSTIIKENKSKGMFYFFPLIVSILFYFFGNYTKELDSIFSNSLSIFIGLFINLLVLIPSVIMNGKGKKVKIRAELVREMFYNISYVTVVSVIALVILIIKNSIKCNVVFEKILIFIFIYIFTNISLTLTMIIKRVFRLFEYDLRSFNGR